MAGESGMPSFDNKTTLFVYFGMAVNRIHATGTQELNVAKTFATN